MRIHCGNIGYFQYKRKVHKFRFGQAGFEFKKLRKTFFSPILIFFKLYLLFLKKK